MSNNEPVLSPEQRAYKDFRVFVYLIWKFLKLPDPTPLQYELANYLQDTTQRRKLIMAFRGMGKSYLTSAYVLWRLYRDSDENILVVSASKDRSDAFSRFTKMLVGEMPLLQHMTPRQGHGFDSIERFTVGNAMVSQSPSVKSLGLYGQLTGSRASIIIADDVETPNNSESQTQRDKLVERTKEFSAILKPDDSDGGTHHQIIYLGTPQTEDSIYNKLPERGYNVRIWPARIPKPRKVPGYKGNLSPSISALIEQGTVPAGTPTDTRFDEGELFEREAEYGRSGFALQFQLDTTLSDAEKYPLKTSDLIVMDVDSKLAPEKAIWNSSKDNIIADLPNLGLQGDRFYSRIPVKDEKWLEYSGSVMTIDPSGRGKDETGYCVSKMLNGQIFIRRCGGFKGGYDQKTLSSLAVIAKEEEVNLILVEPNFGDGLYSEVFKPVLRRIYDVSVEDAPLASGQKELRIIDTLEPLMNQHRLIMDKSLLMNDAIKSDESDPNYTHRKLAHQLTRITKDRGSLRHDDRLDALAMSCRYWVDQVAVDTDEAMRDYRNDLAEQELERFMEFCVDKPSPTHNTWLAPMGILES